MVKNYNLHKSSNGCPGILLLLDFLSSEGYVVNETMISGSSPCLYFTV